MGARDKTVQDLTSLRTHVLTYKHHVDKMADLRLHWLFAAVDHFLFNAIERVKRSTEFNTERLQGINQIMLLLQSLSAAVFDRKKLNPDDLIQYENLLHQGRVVLIGLVGNIGVDPILTPQLPKPHNVTFAIGPSESVRREVVYVVDDEGNKAERELKHAMEVQHFSKQKHPVPVLAKKKLLVQPAEEMKTLSVIEQDIQDLYLEIQKSLAQKDLDQYQLLMKRRVCLLNLRMSACPSQATEQRLTHHYGFEASPQLESTPTRMLNMLRRLVNRS